MADFCGLEGPRFWAVFVLLWVVALLITINLFFCVHPVPRLQRSTGPACPTVPSAHAGEVVHINTSELGLYDQYMSHYTTLEKLEQHDPYRNRTQRNWNRMAHERKHILEFRTVQSMRYCTAE